jgi:predicted adenylyl cyclase CyaB
VAHHSARVFAAQLFAKHSAPPQALQSPEMRNSGGVEVELKYLQVDLEEVRHRLIDAGARLEAPRSLESNQIFDDGDESLRHSKRLLRLRNGHELTVKLPLEDAQYKSRQEINLDVADGNIEGFLAGLGYESRWQYQKWREGWDLEGMWVTLDELPFVGEVVEIEGDRDRIDAVAERIGLAGKPTSTANYQTLYLDYCAARGMAPGDMTFSAEAAQR